MKKEDLKQVYGTPSKEFHERVVQTLDSLEEKPVVRYGGSARRKIVAIGIAAAVLGTFTITAAATNFFGLTATRKGTYGLNLKVESNVSDEESDVNYMMLDFGYMSDKYSSGKMLGNYEFVYYVNENEYFNAVLRRAKDFEMDLCDVIDTSEDVIDGHKTVFVTFREAENTDNMRYSSFKYFDEDGYLIRCNGSDYEELVKITEKANIKPATKISYDDYDDYSESDSAKHGALVEYHYEYRTRLVSDFFDNKVKKVSIGESMEFSVADYEQEAVKLTAKVVSLEKRDNADGLEYDNFDATTGKNVYYDYFNSDGTLIREREFQTYDEGDEEHLSKIEYHKVTRDFYVAEIEITAEDDIDNLYDVFGMEVQIIDEKERTFYGCMNDDYSDVHIIYGANIDNNIALQNPISLKKGETVILQSGFVTESNITKSNIDENVYFMLSAVDEPNDLYQNYVLKIKE